MEYTLPWSCEPPARYLITDNTTNIRIMNHITKVFNTFNIVVNKRYNVQLYIFLIKNIILLRMVMNNIPQAYHNHY